MGDDKRHQDNLDPEERSRIGQMGGQASAASQDMSKLGQKGGQAAQQSGNAHQLPDEERSRGGQNSSTSGAFSDDD